MFSPQEKRKAKTKRHREIFGGDEYVYDFDYGDSIRVSFLFFCWVGAGCVARLAGS